MLRQWTGDFYSVTSTDSPHKIKGKDTDIEGQTYRDYTYKH